MKKLLVVFVLVFILGGCGNYEKDTPPLPDLNFNGNMSVTYNDFEMMCTIDNNLATGCRITVSEPELISGLNMSIIEGKCMVSMGDIIFEIDSSLYKKSEFASELVEIFGQILKSTDVQKLQNGNWQYFGNTSYGKYNLIQDSVTGYPVSVSLPEADLYIKFRDMKPSIK